MADATATLVIRRASTPYRDRLAGYKVMLDGVVVGSVRNGQTVRFDLAPGAHRLRIRVAGKYSPELALSVGVGDTATLECRPAGSTASALYQSIFRRDAYISLRAVP